MQHDPAGELLVHGLLALEVHMARIDLPTEAAALIRDQQASLAAISLPPELDDTHREAVRAAIAAGPALASAGAAWLMIRPASRGGS